MDRRPRRSWPGHVWRVWVAASVGLGVAACGADDPAPPPADPLPARGAARGAPHTARRLEDEPAPADQAPAGQAGRSGAPRLTEITPEEMPALLARLQGKPLLLNIWSTWCEPCVEELPELLAVAREYRARGLELLLISVDPRTQHDAALALLTELGAPMPSYVKVGSDTAFVGAVHPNWSGSLPATLLFDRGGRLVSRWEEPVDRGKLTGPIEGLLDGGAVAPPSEEP